jgi:hypothetical protein
VPSAPQPPRVRRARSLVGYWDGGDFVLENFVTGTQTVVAPALVDLLRRLTEYTPRTGALEILADVPDAGRLLDQFVDRDLLMIEGSDDDRRDSDLDESWEWSHDARFFHFTTRRVAYEPDLATQRASLADYTRQVPPPSPFTNRSGSRTGLPGSFDEPRGEFWSVLSRRALFVSTKGPSTPSRRVNAAPAGSGWRTAAVQASDFAYHRRQVGVGQKLQDHLEQVVAGEPGMANRNAVPGRVLARELLDVHVGAHRDPGRRRGQNYAGGGGQSLCSAVGWRGFEPAGAG